MDSLQRLAGGMKQTTRRRHKGASELSDPAVDMSEAGGSSAMSYWDDDDYTVDDADDDNVGEDDEGGSGTYRPPGETPPAEIPPPPFPETPLASSGGSISSISSLAFCPPAWAATAAPP